MKIHVEPLPEGMWADGRRVEAFEEMYRRCYPRLVDVCRRSLCGRGDPEAVAQEAFVRAWSSLDSFSGARPFWPWVATIARRLCIDHLRRVERELDNMHVAATLGGECSLQPDEHIETDDERRSALLALERLKPSEQRVIAMRDLNGWSYEQIARFEGVTVEAIRGALKRARASLRDSYARVATGVPVVLGWRLPGVLRKRGRAVSRTPGLPVAVNSAGLLCDVAAGALAVAMSVLAPMVAPARSPTSGTGAAPASAEAPTVPMSQGVGVAPSRGGIAPNEHPPPVGGSGGRAAIPLPLPEDGASTPEDTVVTDLTPSPSYQRDGTAFAVGTVRSGCPYPACVALFRTANGGVDWERLPAIGFAGGAVMLPPAYPVDNRIFVAGPVGLQVSVDAGASFELLTPIIGDAAISPTFGGGDNGILIGHAPVWEYRDDLDATQPAGLVVPSSAASAVPLFSPNYAEDATVFLGATLTSSSGAHRSAVFRCAKSVCGEASVLDGATGSPALAASGDSLLAWRGELLFVSTNGGHSFDRAPLPLTGVVRDVTFGLDGRLYVAVRGTSSTGESRGGVVVSADRGASWKVLGAGSALDNGVESILVGRDRIVAAPSGDVGGLLCSTDDGRSWEPRCAA